MKNFLMYFLIISLVLTESNSIKCGEKEIQNCIECGTEEKSNTCIKCQDKYFLFFNNLYCIPCDDPLYGDVGCGGSCSSSSLTETRNIICEENGCKEGFYNLNGKCFNCSEGQYGCKKCKYEEVNGEKKFKCEECLNNEFYLDEDDSTCYRCGPYMCEKCHYELENGYDYNYYSSKCDKCLNGFYLDSNFECQKCSKIISIQNGGCRICSENETDLDSGPCWCDTYFTQRSHSTCIPCPDNCEYCEYNNQENNVECIKCNPGFTINQDKTCTSCGEGCKYCSLDKNSNPICSDCFSEITTQDNKCIVCPDNCKNCEYDKNGKKICLECNSEYTLDKDGICKSCPSNCSSCYTNESNEILCKKCYEHYGLSSDEKCILCSNIAEIGGKGCEKCGYNKNTLKYECYECKKIESENSYEMIDAYAFVKNTFQCFNNSDPNNETFYGCLIANYNEETQKYECLTCKEYNNYYSNYVYVINQGLCKEINDINIGYCIEAENIGNESQPQYSCTKCNPETVIITSFNNITKCEDRYSNLAYCLEGNKDISGTTICSKCVPNSKLNNSNLCECNSDSFSKYNENWCYKCDDQINGIPGCEASNGCNYNSANHQINCNQCKEGYFSYTQGQCFSCSFEISNCEKCHFDESDNKLVCDKCPEGYSYNSEGKKCELKNCEDYPEISEGCLICEGNIEIYSSKKICQSCKPGYFKTKDNQCVYCKSEKYGGPACFKCKYAINENGEDTDNIQCEFCPERNHALSSDGKCYKCSQFLPNSCEECGFVRNDNNIEKLVCTLCRPGYYMDSKGECINYLNNLEKIPNCRKYHFKVNNIDFCSYDYNNDKYYYENDNYDTFYCYKDDNQNTYYSYGSFDSFYNNYNRFGESLDIDIPEINYEIKTECLECSENYFIDSNGKCDTLKYEDCSLISIINNFPKRYEECRRYCERNNNVYLDLTLNNGNIIKIVEFFDKYQYGSNYIPELSFNELDDNLKPLFVTNNLCVSTNNNFKNCNSVIRTSNGYKCNSCYDMYYYFLDERTNSCIYKYENRNTNDYNCILENIGTNSNPIYSCSECFSDHYTLVKNEFNIKYCIYENEELQYCKEANANTTYVNSLYNCTSCSINFIPYYSEFFGRKICQNVYDNNIITEKEISLDEYKNEESILAIDGKCQDNNFFTPDGINCYPCNSKVGMPGCIGSCSFSLNRNIILKCEGECENGYIESSEGVCEKCDSVNHGCYECHYETEYPADFIGIKRKRRFICDYCEDGYFKSNGKCLNCEEMGLDSCDKCEIDPNNNNEYICTKCQKWNVIDDDGECDSCDDSDELIINNKCISCDDAENGGIKGCEDCEKDGDKVICQSCLSGYILLKNNNTCLEISKNKELQKFESCEQLSLDNNNKLQCLKCKREFSLLKENNDVKCLSIPILYDYAYKDYYEYYYSFIEYKYKSSYYNYDIDYYYQNYQNSPCQEAINLGTETKPIYSCTKCYKLFEYDKAFIGEKNYVTKIINERNNVSFCVFQNRFLLNCTEAINKTKDGIEKYDCIKCSEGNNLMYSTNSEIHYCSYVEESPKCMVKYCKTCQNNNNFFCLECLLSNYEVNTLTGSCVEKTAIVPAVTWKDIFRLEMNSNKEINGKTIYGPTLTLRGITSSDITTRHAFLIYLTFKIRAGRNIRNLDEEKVIPAICEVANMVDEVDDDLKLVDYECVGNNTDNEDLTNYDLDNIDEGNDTQNIKKTNLEDLVEKTDFKELENKNEPVFTLQNFKTIITFGMDQINNQSAVNNTFDFQIDGKINKDVEPTVINTQLDLNEIEEKADCNFTIGENRTANLNCEINVEQYKERKTFSFKTSEIKENNKEIFLSKINEVILLNGIEKTEEKKNDGKNEGNQKGVEATGTKENGDSNSNGAFNIGLRKSWISIMVWFSLAFILIK